MFKLRIYGFLFVAGFLPLLALAQQFTFQSPDATPIKTPPTPAVSVLSADEFKNRAKALNEQNQKNLLQQAAQTLSKQAPLAVPPPITLPKKSSTPTLDAMMQLKDEKKEPSSAAAQPAPAVITTAPPPACRTRIAN